MININPVGIKNLNKQQFASRPAFSGSLDSLRGDKVELGAKLQIKPETLQQLKALKGPATLNTNKITEILLQDKGIDPKLIVPKDKTAQYLQGIFKNQNNGICGFSYITGELSVTKSLIYYMNNGQYAAVIAHELDHFINFAKLCKYMGVDEYEKLVLSTAVNLPFNRDFWQKASQAVDIENFDPEPIKNNIIDLLNPKTKFGFSGAMEHTLEYLNSPLEKSAYSLQYEIEDALGVKPNFVSHRGEAGLIEGINAAFNNAAAKNPKIADYKEELIDLLYEFSLRFIHKPIIVADKKIIQCQQSNKPVDEKYIKKYNKEVRNAILKMNPAALPYIFNPQKCSERKKTFYEKIAYMLETSPLETYLYIASKKRLALLKSIKTDNLNAEQKRVLEDEIKAAQAKFERLNQ